MAVKKDISDEPSSSISGQVAVMAPPGLSLEIEISDTCLGDTDWCCVVEAAVTAALKGGLSGPIPAAEIYVELINNEKSQILNNDYRGKDRPTNVLSFPGVEPDDLPKALKVAAKGGPPVMFGDIMIADEVVLKESREQNKTTHDHLTHLVVHGVLHLLGYDHMKELEAEEMEALEAEILAELGITNPYGTIEK